MEENLPRFNRIYYKGFFVENFKKNSNTDDSDLTGLDRGGDRFVIYQRTTVLIMEI